MNREKLQNVINSVILTIEKLILFVPKTTVIIKYYLELLFFMIKKYRLYDKIDLYLDFALQLDILSKKRMRYIVMWILNQVLPSVGDEYFKARVYYFIARVFFYLKHYNKAQNFAVKAAKHFYSVFDSSKPVHLLFYFELNLLICKLAFYRAKYLMAYNLLQHMFSKLVDLKIEDMFDRDLVNIILESSLWMIVCYVYVNKSGWESSNVKEVINHFIDMVSSFKNYLDIEKLKENINNVLFKNIKKLLIISPTKSKRKKRKYYQDLLNLAYELSERVEKIPNIGRVFLDLYKDYIIIFMICYPDNYKIATRVIMKAIFLNYYYIRSSNLVALSKFLLFKVMKLQSIYNDLTDYLKSVDVQEYILSNPDIEQEVRNDIINKRVVLLEMK
ncbi:MAG: hypothetical protein ABDH21_04995 [bacterium]